MHLPTHVNPEGSWSQVPSDVQYDISGPPYDVNPALQLNVTAYHSRYVLW